VKVRLFMIGHKPFPPAAFRPTSHLLKGFTLFC